MSPAAGAVRRLAAAAATVVGVTFATFVLLVTAPGDPLVALTEQSDTVDQETQRALRQRLGLDRPVLRRYADWCADLLSGDLGTSLRTGEPVTRTVLARLGPTVELNAVAFAGVVLVGLPLGWWAARRPGARFDRVSVLVLLMLYAAPSFWLALELQDLFAVRLGWLPVYGRTPGSESAGLLERGRHILLPAAVLGLHQLAFYARFARNTAVGSWHSAHARTARAAGVGGWRVFVRHAVRPSAGPLVTLLGLLVPAFAAGSIVVENVFSWPGLGFLYVSAIQTRDVPVVLGLTFLTGLLTVCGSVLADALGAAVDPRRRIGAAS